MGYSFVSREPARKGGFDQLPAHCKIRVTFGQRPYGVKVIGQHHDGIDREWMALARLTKRRAQVLDMSVSNDSFRSANLLRQCAVMRDVTTKQARWACEPVYVKPRGLRVVGNAGDDLDFEVEASKPIDTDGGPVRIGRLRERFALHRHDGFELVLGVGVEGRHIDDIV